MSWPVDNTKLERVRSMMKEQDISALVCRAPDNVVYLTNYWGMKGYDAVVFPQQGEPTLITLEPQQQDAGRNSWTRDIRLFDGYHPSDPRPPQFRAFDIARSTIPSLLRCCTTSRSPIDYWPSRVFRFRVMLVFR